jgi:replicative DNA helicase
MSTIFNDPNVEKKLLSLFFKPSFYIKLLNINMDLFNINSHKKLAELMRSFIQKYKSIPTKETLINYSNELVKTSKQIDQYSDALLVLEDLPDCKEEEACYYLKKAENYMVGRAICDMNTYVVEQIESNLEIDFLALRQHIFKSTLHMGSDSENVKRGFIYDNIGDRARMYGKMKRGENTDLIKFGIDSLDKIAGGMKKTFLTLLYSRTGGGKTKFAVNIAYNAAKAGYNVMYASLEMASEYIGYQFDSLMSFIDSSHIVFGNMTSEEEKRYSKALNLQKNSKLPIWITDIPRGASIAKLIEEIELYKTHNGFVPDLVVVDYANLIEPTMRYSGRSEQYDYLLKEMHETARFYEFAMLTMMQESRTASMDDLKKKNKKMDEDIETDGTHNIGLSNFAAIHCENVFRIKWDKRDQAVNRINLIIDKNRYGKTGGNLKLFANFAITYIGDQVINTQTIKS